MKKKILFMGFAIFLFNTAHAETPLEKQQAQRLDFLTKKLNLTTKQRAAIQATLQEMEPKWQAFNKEFADKRKALADEADSKIIASLSSSQRIKYSQLKAEQKADSQKKQAQRKKLLQGQ